MRKQALFVCLMTGLLLGADDPKTDPVKKELAKLQGAWTVVSAELNGKPDASRKGAHVVFAGDTFTRTSPAQSAKGTLKLDPAAKPATIDITFTDGPDKGKSLFGIYTLEGDTFKICSSPRPTEFSSKAGSQLLLVLQRDKPPAPVVKAPPVPPFPDTNLEAAVRAVLQEPKGELTDDKLLNVYILEAPGKQLKSLKGLEKCKNLALLKVTTNQLSDLTPLKELVNLQSLDLASNQISDLTPLKGLTGLQYLELSNNQVVKVDALSGLGSLSALYLTGNKVSDIAPLAGLTKLSSLYLGHNQIKDIAALAKVTRISTLELKENQISDLTPLKKQTELSMLLIEKNKITDLTPLAEMCKADAQGEKRFAPYLRLYLAGNPLSDTAKSKQLTELKSYGVRIEQQ
jgi:internalin A